ncbi:lysosomal Pro-X carboxypeptidase-like [Branchiostoma floridae x Branchiostoma belcheri]
MGEQRVSLVSLLLAYVVLNQGSCSVSVSGTNVPGYQTRYVEVQVDHFSFANSDTFQLRYLVNDTYFKPGGPVFLYTGNEGDIEDFVKNTGLLIEMAPRFGAMVIFAEHRYYGQSLPYGQDSFKDPAHLGYLTSTQALADFAELIVHLKETICGTEDSPVFAFGGSYGGMLAAWIRMKYPHLVAGSLASAASIFQFPGITDCETYSHVATRTFQRSGAGCPEIIRSSWDVIQDLGKTDPGLRKLTSMFHLCTPLTSDDMPTLVDWLVNLWMIYALIDYPYPANFLTPLPAWPVKEACQLITSHEDVVSGVAAAAKLYFNYTRQTACLDISQPYYGGLAWQYQVRTNCVCQTLYNVHVCASTLSRILTWNLKVLGSYLIQRVGVFPDASGANLACTEQIEPICSDGVNDMFPPIPWDLAVFSQACYERWKVRPRPYWAVTEYWGRNISAASNIIFSNGDLDPWSAGCVLKSLSDSLVAIVMEDAAHHLDLRPSDPADPSSHGR